MKPLYFTLWLAGGGLILLEAFLCQALLRVCESHHAADSQQSWDFLIPGAKS